MDTLDLPARTPEVITPGSGHHLHFLDHLATVKVRSDDELALSVVEFTAPRGLGPPLHRHHDEDELFIVLEGELAFHVGEERTPGTTGCVAILPRGIAHTFQVHSPVARFVCVTGARGGNPRFDAMVTALGVAVAEPSLPAPGPIDPDEVAAVCAAHGIEVLGPPPPPLDVR